MKTKTNNLKDYEKEEWGGWKFVSEMLNNPNGGIYPTSKCYQKLYEFVCEQKKKSHLQGYQQARGEIKDILTSEGGGIDCLYEYLGFKVSKSKEQTKLKQ